MKTQKFVWLAVLAGAVLACAASARAFDETPYGHNARLRAELRPWHGRYYHQMYGQPIALIVPPTAELQTDYGWGVGNTRVTRIDHQFQRPFPGYGHGGVPFQATPAQPGDTRHFGVYYVRGPW